MDRLIKRFQYRPEVDGLRSIAVMSVVLFHAGFGVSGGFVGVDVFFVISGYLITTLILKEMESGKFNFAEFWARRARRILPAVALVAFVCLIGGWFLMLPIQYADLGRSAAYMAMLVANVYFYLGTGYFAGASEEKPLLHTWSLAVEEQYYLIFPLALFVLYRWNLLRERRRVLVLFGLGIVLGLAACIYIQRAHPAAAFYLLPTRAWELLLGSFVAVIPACNVSRTVREIVAGSGIAAILIPCWLYDKTTPFPGWAAVPPCVGTALVIQATWVEPGVRRPFAAAILSSPPFVFVGLISYSLYLWHWPLIAIGNYWGMIGEHWYFRWGVVLLSTLLAILSWRYVETPFRKKGVLASRGGILAFSGVTGLLLFGSGIFIYFGGGMGGRLPEGLREAFARNPADDLEFVENLQVSQVLTGEIPAIGDVEALAEPKIVVWGDSHAMAAMPAFDALLKERGISGRYCTHSSRAPLLEWYGQDAIEEKAFSESVYKYVKGSRIENIVLIGCWTGYDRSGETERLQKCILKTVERLRGVGCQPWVMTMVPNHRYEVPKALALATFLRRNESEYCSWPSAWNGIAGTGEEFLRRLENAGGRIIDPRPEFIDPKTGNYRMSLDGHALYRDQHHLSKQGALRVVLPLLERVMITNVTNRSRAGSGQKPGPMG